jgi:hypothetical protein
MSLVKWILKSKYTKVKESIDRGDNINMILNGNPHMTMLDVAIQTNDVNPSSKSASIVSLLKERGALTYNDLANYTFKEPSSLPPLYVKGTVRDDIKKTGIAGLSRGGTRRIRSRHSRRKIRF